MPTPRRLLPSIAALRALEALDRLGSASGAAEELALTQGAVSRQIQALEHQLGVDLVVRDRKKLYLTEAAANYAEDIRAALDRIARASLTLQGSTRASGVNLAILPTFGMRWLMPRLPGFSRRFPDVTINMATRLVPFNFAEEQFDAAIHFGRPDWPGCDALLLKQEQMLPACSPELIAGRTMPLPPADIAALPLLHIQTRPQAWRDWFKSQDLDTSANIDGAIYDQFATIIQAALHGMGVALLPDYLIEQDLATGRLVALAPRPEEIGGAYYLIWPHSKARHPGLSLFREWLAGQAQPEDPLPR